MCNIIDNVFPAMKVLNPPDTLACSQMGYKMKF